MTLAFSVKDKIQTQKGSNKRLSILPRTHSVPVFGEIPFVKPQDDKRLKTMENKRKNKKNKSSFGWLFVQTEQATKAHPKQDTFLLWFFLSFFLKIYLFFNRLSVV